MRTPRRLILCAGFFCAASLPAQVALSGSVSGLITYGDTQRPARFARVTLTPAAPPAPKLKSKEPGTDPSSSAAKALNSLMTSVTMLQAQTGLDGTYTIQNVAPGDYLLAPTAPGYVSPLTVTVIASGPGARKSGAPVIHVEAGRTSRGDFALERGAALSGTAHFEDGSPAAGLIVSLDEVEKPGAKKPGADDDDLAGFSQGMAAMFAGGLIMTTTDDRGHFRMAGVPAGEYRVEAKLVVGGGLTMRAGVMDVSAAGSATPLVFYIPGTLHKTDAAKFELRPGEERSDLELRLDLGALRNVTGHVSSAVDHHSINSGTVTLTDTADKNLKRTGAVDSTGAFTVAYVPPGTYTLLVSGAGDTEPRPNNAQGSGRAAAGLMRFTSTHTLRSYDDATQAVIVSSSDVTGVNLELKESAKVKKDVDIGRVLGGISESSPE